MIERLRTVAIVCLMAVLLCTACGALLTFLVPDFAAPVRGVLSVGPPLKSVTDGINFIEDGGPDTGAAEVMSGMRIVILGALLLGMPLAIAAAFLARRQWDSGWQLAFRAGSIVQMGSLGFAALILAVVISDVGLAFVTEMFPVAAFLLADILMSAIALRWWARLQNGPLATDRAFPVR